MLYVLVLMTDGLSVSGAFLALNFDQWIFYLLDGDPTVPLSIVVGFLRLVVKS
jgi:hypothetical protein